MKNKSVLILLSFYRKLILVVMLVIFLVVLYFCSIEFIDIFRMDRYRDGGDTFFRIFILFVIGFVGYILALGFVISVVDHTLGVYVRNRSVTLLRRQFRSLIQSDFEWVWFDSPGIFGIDCRKGYLLVNYISTGYTALRLDAANILSSKVERSAYIETTTTRGVESLSDLGRRDLISRSTSRARESFVLEIAYKSPDNVPYVVSIPFGEDRISAERAQYMIQMFA